MPSASLAAAPVAAYVAVNFSSTITLGSVILGALLAAAGLVILGYGARFRAAYEAEKLVSGSYLDGRNAFQARADRLEMQLGETQARNDELADLIGEQKKTIARLENLPNLERIVQVMAETSTRQDSAASERLRDGLTQVGEMVRTAIATHDHAAELRARSIVAAIEAAAADRLDG